MTADTRDAATLIAELREESSTYEQLRRRIKALPGQIERSPLPERIARGLITHHDTLVEALRFVKTKKEKLRDEQAMASRHAVSVLFDWWEHSTDTAIAEGHQANDAPLPEPQTEFYQNEVTAIGTQLHGMNECPISSILNDDRQTINSDISDNNGESAHSEVSSVILSENAIHSEHDDEGNATEPDLTPASSQSKYSISKLLHCDSSACSTPNRPFTVPIQENSIKVGKVSPYQKSSTSWKLREQLEYDEKLRRLAALDEHAERRRRGCSNRQAYLSHRESSEDLLSRSSQEPSTPPKHDCDIFQSGKGETGLVTEERTSPENQPSTTKDHDWLDVPIPLLLESERPLNQLESHESGSCVDKFPSSGKCSFTWKRGALILAIMLSPMAVFTALTEKENLHKASDSKRVTESCLKATANVSLAAHDISPGTSPVKSLAKTLQTEAAAVPKELTPYLFNDLIFGHPALAGIAAVLSVVVTITLLLA